MDATNPSAIRPTPPRALMHARIVADRGLVPIGAGFALLLLIAVGSLWLKLENRRQAARVAHALEVLVQAVDVRRNVRAAEVDQRGFLLTEDPLYLDKYAAQLSDTRASLDSLARMTAGDPVQQANFRRVRIAAEAKIADMNRVAGNARMAKARGSLLIAESDDLMEELREAVIAVHNEERRRLRSRQAAVNRVTSALLAANLTGVFAIVALGLVATEEMRRRAERLENSERELRLLNEGLEATVAERTADVAESNEDIQRYAHIVSHDLRSPLVNIMGFTSELEKTIGVVHGELAATGSEKAEATKRDADESLAYIKAAIGKMDKLIGELLKLSREGRRVLRPEPLDLRQIATSAVASIKHQTESAGAAIEIGAFPSIVADRAAVEQIIGNLIDNAVKYLDPARAGEIRISGSERGGRVRIDVADNGRGIAAEDQARVFDMFRRAGALTAPGEGIGLAYARLLARSMGGRIELQSKPGAGSTFTLVLPARPAAYAPPAQPERAA